MPSADRNLRPSAITWLLAIGSLLLPIAGVGLGLYGAFRAFAGSMTGWAWLGAGIVILIADLVIDSRWSYRAQSSEPDLNLRGEQLVGQVVTVIEAIPLGGRGVVRAADTVWPAEGAAAEEGAKVRITACKGTVLTVDSV